MIRIIHPKTILALLPLAIAVSAPANAAAKCAPVSLAVSAQSKLTAGSSTFRTIAANFAKAYSKACTDGLLKKRSLPSRIFLLNAPNANIGSIYKTGGRTVLEYPFVSEDRKTQVPGVDELHEAIFCAVHGASKKEQEDSGRCLPD